MTDTEALGRLLAWIERDSGRRVVTCGDHEHGYWVRLSYYPRTVAGDSSQMGDGAGFAEAVDDALARAPE